MPAHPQPPLKGIALLRSLPEAATPTVSLSPQPKLIRVRTGNGPPKVNPQGSQPVTHVIYLEVIGCACQTLSLRNLSKEAEAQREMPTS